MSFKNFFTIAAASALLFTVSCRNDDPVVEIPKGDYQNGILISNEGNFGKPNASVSWANPDFSSVKNEIYQTVNNENLGDVLQSISFNGDLAYLVANNSNKVIVANRYTMKKEKEITDGLKLPRYSTVAGNYLYVTNSSGNTVAVYNLSTNDLVKKLTVTDAAERIVTAGKTVFVENASWGSGNKLTLINSADNTIKKEVTVPAGNIQKTVAYNGSVYTITNDKSAKASYIYQFSEAGDVVKTFTMSNISNAKNLEIDQNKIYFTSGLGVYSMDLNATAAPTAPVFNVTDNSWSTLYGFNVIDGKIYTADAKGFTEASEITVYSTTGAVLKTFKAGMGTNGFYKN